MFHSRCLAALAALTLALPATAQEVTLRLQHFVAPGSANPSYFMEPWARKIEAGARAASRSSSIRSCSWAERRPRNTT